MNGELSSGIAVPPPLEVYLGEGTLSAGRDAVGESDWIISCQQLYLGYDAESSSMVFCFFF